MRVVIIEDEALASERLKKMILSYNADIDIAAQLESVEESVEWLRNNAHPELIFLDIHLEDDLSFAIFEKIEVKSSIIFTTAFDEYAIQAFKLRSIDYLLKPIIQEDLEAALRKYSEMRSELNSSTDLHTLYDLIVQKNNTYKERFSVQIANKIKTFNTEDIAYFRSEGGYTTAYLHSGKSFCVDSSLDALSKDMNPKHFFRINRQMLVRLTAIKEVHVYAKSRLKLDIEPSLDDAVYVSLDKVSVFKKWLEGN